jgi:hypothetical protein
MNLPTKYRPCTKNPTQKNWNIILQNIHMDSCGKHLILHSTLLIVGENENPNPRGEDMTPSLVDKYIFF